MSPVLVAGTRLSARARPRYRPVVATTPRIGLVLGSGSARGWAHLGVIQALAARGVQPDLVAGCSIGALVGAAHANGQAEALAEWVSSLLWQDVIRLFDLDLQSGILKGEKVMRLFAERFVDATFGELRVPFACIATDLGRGQEIWLREGRVAEAVRASIALPGLFSPVRRDGRWLVDGGLVNPIPVALARAMGADVVVAVDLGADLIGSPQRTAIDADTRTSGLGRLTQRFTFRNGEDTPSLTAVMNATIHIMQTRIARSRLAGDPPDVVIAPRLGPMGVMDFHRGAEAIAAGREAVEMALPLIERVLRA